MAERAKKPAKKAAKTEKPAVLTGAVPEWSNTTAIAKILGKTVRRIQQLTQEGVLETEVPPNGGARKYRTCETVQRYIAHVEQKAQETGENGRTAELNLKKLEAEVELKESQGQLHRLKTRHSGGQIHFRRAGHRGTGGVYGGFQEIHHEHPAAHGRDPFRLH